MKKISIFLMLAMGTLGFSQGPTTNAPVPTKLAANVVSVFSDSYTDIATNYNPNWGQSGFATTSPTYDPTGGGTNFVLAYTNFNYQGTELTPTNLSAMEYLHVDIWTTTATNVKVSPINNGTGVGEFLVNVPLVNGSWSSVDIPKSAFTGMTWDSVFQIKFDGQGGVNPSNIYLDNIYFWKSPTDPVKDATLSDLKVNGTTISGFGSATTNYTYELVVGTTTAPTITAVTTTNSGATTTITQATGVPGTATVVVKSADGTVTNTYTVNFVATKPTAAPKPTIYNAQLAFLPDVTDTPGFSNYWTQDFDFGVNQGRVDLDPSATVNNALKMDFSVAGWGAGTNAATNINAYDFVHFDYFVPNEAPGVNGHEFRFILIGGAEYNYVIQPTGGDGVMVLGSWQSVDIPLTFFTNKGFSKTNFLQFKLGSESVLKTKVVYFDNIYMYNSTSGVLGVNDVKGKADNLQVYPNPVAANTEFNIAGKVSSVKVYNMNGQIVKTASSSNVNTQNMTKGVYIVEAKLEDGSVKRTKLMVK